MADNLFLVGQMNNKLVFEITGNKCYTVSWFFTQPYQQRTSGHLKGVSCKGGNNRNISPYTLAKDK